jgi:hypothetical protein
MNWHASSPLEPIRQLSRSLGAVDATIVVPEFSTKIWSTEAHYEPTFEKILHANCPIPGLNPGPYLKELDLKGVAILKWRPLQACQPVEDQHPQHLLIFQAEEALPDGSGVAWIVDIQL